MSFGKSLKFINGLRWKLGACRLQCDSQKLKLFA